MGHARSLPRDAHVARGVARRHRSALRDASRLRRRARRRPAVRAVGPPAPAGTCSRPSSASRIPSGNQFWHLHDPTHPAWDPALAARLGNAVARVYRRLDDALAAHLALLPPDDLVIVLMSHGMGPLYTGDHLLDRLLARLEAHAAGGPWGNPSARVLKQAWSGLPLAMRRRLHGRAARAIRARVGAHPTPTVEPRPRPTGRRPWSPVPSGNTVPACPSWRRWSTRPLTTRAPGRTRCRTWSSRGAGIRRATWCARRDLARDRVDDGGPTLAARLGVTRPDVDGRPAPASL